MGVGVDAQTDLVAEIVGLKVAIDRAAEAARISLAGRPSASRDDRAWAEREELNRQLGALRERVAAAERRNEGPHALRAELATLLFFARRALQADTDDWRSALKEQLKQLGRQKTAARKERERLAADREKLARRRDALQLTILQTAARAGAAISRGVPQDDTGGYARRRAHGLLGVGGLSEGEGFFFFFCGFPPALVTSSGSDQTRVARPAGLLLRLGQLVPGRGLR